ncbi:hypothetical protein LRA02_15410 [Lentilactobacillus rapi]|uniref:Uncharacterized protein n=1 Tax=Lentilactobacillus rapi TaxID=481723 RepID=A0A512PND0_9LACO|nr:hypothetical protein LRA02_15410 [Lentilactobacillus rapi]
MGIFVGGAYGQTFVLRSCSAIVIKFTHTLSITGLEAETTKLPDKKASSSELECSVDEAFDVMLPKGNFNGLDSLI